MSEDREDLEQEIVVEEVGEEAEAPAPKAKRPVEREQDGGEELESYSKNVQKRIQKLTEKYRQEERDREEAVRIANQLLEENNKLRSRVTQLDSGYLNEYGNRVEAQVAQARQAYKEAYESGDSDKIVAAQEALSRAVADKDRYELTKNRAAARAQMEQERPAAQSLQAPVQQQPAQRQQPDPKAQSWAEKNTWFGQNEVMTYAAFGIHRKLVEEEGFDPQSDEYYTEVDRRMRAEFPHKFKDDRKQSGPQVASAGSSASRSPHHQGRRTVKLTPSQIAIARKLNVPLEEYAKYVKE